MYKVQKIKSYDFRRKEKKMKELSLICYTLWSARKMSVGVTQSAPTKRITRHGLRKGVHEIREGRKK